MNHESFIRCLLTCVVFVCLTDVIHAETRTVKTQVLVAASPERVLRSFVDKDDLEGWWKVSRSLVQERTGGVWSVVWDDYGEAGTQHAWVGMVEEVSPRHLRIGNLVMIEPGRPLFGPLELDVVVAAADGGSTLIVYHRGYQSGEDWDWMHDTVVKGWKHVLGDLQEWLLDSAVADRNGDESGGGRFEPDTVRSLHTETSQ
jgi:uncharacterized protein YndB with AHSA1/START domain